MNRKSRARAIYVEREIYAQGTASNRAYGIIYLHLSPSPMVALVTTNEGPRRLQSLVYLLIMISSQDEQLSKRRNMRLKLFLIQRCVAYCTSSCSSSISVRTLCDNNRSYFILQVRIL